ncbi:MAG: PLD nuclease N-terminal domain-containing protein [Eggerthellaceae bacterium]|nr:PLD nuclease N-terminal domain-containing protein [Eggerthellaceae bacterium]MCH4220499.1 PLD nuclease N-terminal domain-containing protein [Eggerthellaceae bacterium]
MPQHAKQSAINLDKEPFYKRTWFIVLLSIFFPIIGVPMAWIFKKPTNIAGRIALTVYAVLLIVYPIAFSDSVSSSSSKHADTSVVEQQSANEPSTNNQSAANNNEQEINESASNNNEQKADAQSNASDDEQDNKSAEDDNVLITSSGEANSDAIISELKRGISYDGFKARWDGDIEKVSSSSDGSANGTWVVVDAFMNSYWSGDSYLTENVDCAAALAKELQSYPSVSKVVWNGHIPSTSGQDMSVMQVAFTTDRVPAYSSKTDQLLKSSKDYTIKPDIYNQLDKYKSLPKSKN